MRDRALDFADCFRADIGVGLGADVHVLCTDYFSTGVGASHVRKAGFKGRHTGTWADWHFGFPVFSLIGIFSPSDEFHPFFTDRFRSGLEGHWSRENEGKYGASTMMFFFTKVSRDIDEKLRKKITVEGYTKEYIKSFDIEVGATLGLMGCRVGFSFGQFVDFLSGWFGADLGNDDTDALEAKFQEMIADLKSKNRDWRSRAVQYLGRTGDWRAVEPLIEVIKDKDISVAQDANCALEMITGHTVRPFTGSEIISADTDPRKEYIKDYDKWRAWYEKSKDE